MIDEHLIWDLSRIGHDRKRIEFTNLIRFNGAWFCSFREADLHNSHPTARIRVLRSTDFNTWTSAATFTWDGNDLRDPHLSITAEGLLMINSSIVFGTMQQRTEAIESGYVPKDVENEIDYSKPVFVPNDHPGWRAEPVEADGIWRQSVTWLSRDGIHWGGANCCSTGINTWRWAVTWHNGMGYSVARGRGGRDGGQLYRTRDGRSWRMLAAPLMGDDERCNEASLAFDDDHTVWCFMRRHPVFAVLGRAEGPHYQNWTWRQLQLHTLEGKTCAAEEKLGVQMGGPKLLRLADGRIIAVGRTDAGGVRGEITDAGGPARIGVFHLDVENAALHEWAEIDACSYPDAAEYEGMLHLTYGKRPAREIWAGKMELPQ